MKGRFSIYLHRPLKIVWFDVHELALIAVFYILATLFGGVFWILLIVAPAILIPLSRSKPRGFLGHFLVLFGFFNLTHYPHPTQTEHHE